MSAVQACYCSGCRGTPVQPKPGGPARLPGGLLEAGEPTSWTDHNGSVWKTLTIAGRIKFKHASAFALWHFVLQRDGGRCVACGSSDGLVLDHIISRRNGGSHHPSNLQLLCPGCNARKANLVDRLGAHQ